MPDVAEIMEHWQIGRIIRAIARSFGVDRDTVRKYFRVVKAHGYRPGLEGGSPKGWSARVAKTFPRLGLAPIELSA